MQEQSMNVAVRCKHCNYTIFYKTTPATGIIECKCPRCKQITTINLAFRKAKRPLWLRRNIATQKIRTT